MGGRVEPGQDVECTRLHGFAAEGGGDRALARHRGGEGLAAAHLGFGDGHVVRGVRDEPVDADRVAQLPQLPQLPPAEPRHPAPGGVTLAQLPEQAQVHPRVAVGHLDRVAESPRGEPAQLRDLGRQLRGLRGPELGLRVGVGALRPGGGEPADRKPPRPLRAAAGVVHQRLRRGVAEGVERGDRQARQLQVGEAVTDLVELGVQPCQGDRGRQRGGVGLLLGERAGVGGADLARCAVEQRQLRRVQRQRPGRVEPVGDERQLAVPLGEPRRHRRGPFPPVRQLELAGLGRQQVDYA
ncbi:hypothetical protein [Candidatus Frankia alpina]|uniref:hypothetical protein n=1 Tax=Candidatus Frankia alpina TaxID=2699483 RepID=UPI001F2BF205|nr:hypothetical protein [Candidatus Frankia alpina]